MKTKVNKDTIECPVCKCSFDGGSILETFIKQRNDEVNCWEGMSDEEVEKEMKKCYSPPYRWSNLMAIELPYNHPQHYDGTSFFQCPYCKTTWNRFTEEEEEIPPFDD